MPNNSACRKQDSERPRVKLGIGRLKLSLPLIHVRAYLITINSMVFLSAYSSFSAGWDASILRDEELCVEREELVKHLENITNETVANAVNNYMENILYVTSVLLCLHWIVHGVAISARFDGTFSKCALATWTVHTLVTVVWQMGLAVVLLKLTEVIPTQHPMSRLYAKWTSTLVILLVAIVPVQLFTVLLPFFCFEDGPVHVEEGKIWHTAAATEMHWTTHKSPFPSVYHTQMPKSLVPRLHQTLPKLPVPSLYHTEMPEQILKKSKPSRTNRLPRDEEKGQVEEFPKRNDLSCLEANYINMLGRSPPPYDLSCLEANYIDMLGRSPPPSYHSQDDLNWL